MGKIPRDDFVLLETNRFDKDNHRSFLFTNPVKIITCRKLSAVKDSLFELDDFISRGFYVAGFISYEAGFSFEENLRNLNISPDLPLVWFGVYKDPFIFNHRERLDLFKRDNRSYNVKNLRANIARPRYVGNIKKIKNFIRRGETYQVNYTFKYKFDFAGSIVRFYNDLKDKQSVSYSALIKTADFSILSFSPELFFRKKKDHIEVRPMKGTFERGRNLKEDKYNMEELEKSLKNRSENVMIVDLLRNDLGRISEAGTVKTRSLFKVEKYETLLQMISIVKSRLKKDVLVYDLFKAIFPSGSVTGAPKINTMKIINSLERESRSVYTGGIGFFAPEKEAVFSVAIRTVLIDNRSGRGEMGVGSGIVYDAEPYKEFEECKLKADFLIQEKKEFKLIETILWRPKKGYFLLKYHLDRLLSSAKFFGFRGDKKAIIDKLNRLERRLAGNSRYRVRLLLDKGGKVDANFSVIADTIDVEKTRFSEKEVRSNDIFLHHKTTERAMYDQEHEKWRKRGYFDIMFTNEKNQVTEGAISNIIVKNGNFYYTPPLDCGLLNGVFRRTLFDRKGFPIKEKILYRDDLYKADKIYMVNSVRGMIEARLD